MANEIQTVQDEIKDVSMGFSTAAGFALLQRMAKMFCTSSLVPDNFRGEQNFGNCCIALNISQRLKADPLMVMQNIVIIHGKPSWSATFSIAAFNSCGRYASIKYRPTGQPGTDTYGMIAYTTEMATGETIEGPEVTIAIAKAEGWHGRNGSKWQTMTEQMLRYRAATWLIRTTAPEILMGLMTDDEMEDITPARNITAEAIQNAQKEIAANANKEELPPPVVKQEQEPEKAPEPVPAKKARPF